MHPLEGGAFRLKFRRDRRHGMKLESRFVFYPRYAAEIVVKAWRYLRYTASAMRSLKQVLRRRIAGPTPISPLHRRARTSSTRWTCFT